MHIFSSLFRLPFQMLPDVSVLCTSLRKHARQDREIQFNFCPYLLKIIITQSLLTIKTCTSRWIWHIYHARWRSAQARLLYILREKSNTQTQHHRHRRHPSSYTKYCYLCWCWCCIFFPNCKQPTSQNYYSGNFLTLTEILPCTTSDQNMEQVYSYNSGAQHGAFNKWSLKSHLGLKKQPHILDPITVLTATNLSFITLS